MSASTVNEYYEILKNFYPKLDIIAYTSKTDDEKKQYDMENVNISWKVDILIYSPTIESGVDFNEKNYDTMYVVYSKYSTCPRGLNQMMNRVRKFTNNKIHILFSGVSHNNKMVNIEEIKENYKIIMRRDEMTTYDTLYCYNMKEQMDSENNFYEKFVEMIKKKGHKIERDETEENNRYKKSIDI
jgi:hypothetical protein